jgi:3-phosphoshikimate 1-carboxyvinyltransferase
MAGEVIIFQPGPLRGSIGVPGDKSISHRALIAGAAGSEPLRIAHLNPGSDVRATREALVALGARVADDGRDVVVTGAALASPRVTLDCMNSGSTARMLLGACAGAKVVARFDGDGSLRRRPMEPVAAQLRAFGAKIETSNGRLPMHIFGTPKIQTRAFILLAPSAQVKSALLFAGLFAGIGVSITGDRGSRDHTERLLRYLGADVEWDQRSVRLAQTRLHGGEVTVAGDFSSAAFFITAAAIAPGSAVLLERIGVNPTRIGLLEALQAMGAAIELRNPRMICDEPVADIAVEARPLAPVRVGPEIAVRAIDEIPLIALAAAFAQGVTTIAVPGDLRAKESDRIAAIERLLESVGIAVGYDRGVLRVAGGAPAIRSEGIEARGDHRIAMATGVLACATGTLQSDGAKSLDVSYPGFAAALSRLQQP